MLEMRIAVGADHAGFALKEHLKSALGALGHQCSAQHINFFRQVFAGGRHAVIESRNSAAGL